MRVLKSEDLKLIWLEARLARADPVPSRQRLFQVAVEECGSSNGEVREVRVHAGFPGGVACLSRPLTSRPAGDQRRGAAQIVRRLAGNAQAGDSWERALICWAHPRAAPVIRHLQILNRIAGIWTLCWHRQGPKACWSPVSRISSTCNPLFGGGTLWPLQMRVLGWCNTTACLVPASPPGRPLFLYRAQPSCSVPANWAPPSSLRRVLGG